MSKAWKQAPSSAEESIERADRGGCCSDWQAALANVAIQYNYGCASMAIHIMLSESDVTGDVTADYPQPLWARHLLLSVVFVGSIAGMLVMGVLGDVIGVSRALAVTNSLTVAGSLITSLCAWGSAETVWTTITVGRFILGVGVGGAYPLSASKAAQTLSDNHSPEAALASMHRAACAFFWQGPGSLVPYLVALLLLQVPRFKGVTSLQFRCLLGFGAIPSFLVAFFGWRADRGSSRTAVPTAPPGSKQSAFAEALRHRGHWQALAGTAGSWFLFDVVLYSVVIFSPAILVHIFGSGASLVQLSVRGATTALVAALGSAAGILSIIRGCASPKALNLWGFVLSAVFCGTSAAVFATRPDRVGVLFLLLCTEFFVLYCGPNVGSFVMPVMAFPPEVRSTFAGLSSAAGKLGALVGVLLFPLLDELCGIAGLMAFFAGVSMLGAITSACLLQAHYEHSNEENGAIPTAEAIGHAQTCHGSAESESCSEVPVVGDGVWSDQRVWDGEDETVPFRD